jgi:phenol hydroxylase P0 protein
MVLPPESFKEFCANNNVINMTPEQMHINDQEEDKWRYGTETTLVGQNHSETRNH